MISPMEPHEVQEWLPNFKKVARGNSVNALIEKGYKLRIPTSPFTAYGSTGHFILSGIPGVRSMD